MSTPKGKNILFPEITPNVYRVLLIHAGMMPHYRIPIYRFLAKRLMRDNYCLYVIADGVQPGCPHAIDFPFKAIRLSAREIARYANNECIDVIIDYMELRHRYLFPTYLILNVLMRRKMIYWGQGRDLGDPNNVLKNAAYALEQSMCSAIILYAEHLRKYIPARFSKKTFIANNTLALSYPGLPPGTTKFEILNRYGIHTRKNIICVGRIQERKRIDHLVKALKIMNRPDIGLIIVGPDPEHILERTNAPNIYKLGPIFDNRKYDLLSSADVFCLPGAVGLSIVDAFHCGLPLVTEKGYESAEIMYLKNGVNGFMVPHGDIKALSEKLVVLLDDPDLRNRFSKAARREISEKGSLDLFYKGFRDALILATDGIKSRC